MTRARQDRLLGLLARDGEWATAATLADSLGVTPRSIRSRASEEEAEQDRAELMAALARIQERLAQLESPRGRS